MKKIRILLADDHSVVRSGLRSIFKTNKDFNVIGEAANGVDALRLASRLKPDIVILDVSMPKMNGIEAARAIKEKLPETKILILTVQEKEEYVYEMIRAGASGYVLKDAEKSEIFKAVRAVASGDQFFSPHISELIIDYFVRRKKDADVKPASTKKNLTKREMEIMRLIAQGSSSREIAAKLFLSASTINTHRANLMQKLNIHDTAGLVRFALQQGILD
jgi:two-component system response regulator NreC